MFLFSKIISKYKQRGVDKREWRFKTLIESMFGK